MKKLITISGAALLAASLSGVAFAQGANPSAPQPNSAGNGVIQPGTSSTGTATDRGRVGTTGMSGGTMAPKPNNAELQGNNGNSASGSNSLANPNTAAGAR
jgi:hypothetical protein